MSSKGESNIQTLVSEFLNNASPQEVEEFERLLQERQRSGMYGQGQNIGTMAKSMAKNIQNQLGVTDTNIKMMARSLVADLALLYDPYFSQKEINAILDEYVPLEKKKVKLPPDVLIDMVQHFISYSIGAMAEDEMASLPNEWHIRYWVSFPEDVQRLISGFLNKKITIDECMESIRYILYNGKL